ncbi:F0F1 ATP synthase subunit delta [Thermaurantiacus sp.]
MVDAYASQTTGLAGRYAAALFGLAEADKALDATEAALSRVSAAVSESADMRALIAERRLSRAEIGRTLDAVAAELELPVLVRNFLGVVAANGRTALLPAIIAAFQRQLASFRGETTADVTAAHELTAAQQKALATKLRARTGRETNLHIVVDPTILGGLIVRIGSEQIDDSVKTRLERLGARMKGL